MRRFWQELEHLLDFLWQRTLGRNLLLEFVQLFAVWQFAVEQQIRDFFEGRFVAHFVNVVAAIHEPGVRIDPANGGFACDHAGEPRAILWFCFGGHYLCSR